MESFLKLNKKGFFSVKLLLRLCLLGTGELRTESKIPQARIPNCKKYIPTRKTLFILFILRTDFIYYYLYLYHWTSPSGWNWVGWVAVVMLRGLPWLCCVGCYSYVVWVVVMLCFFGTQSQHPGMYWAWILTTTIFKRYYKWHYIQYFLWSILPSSFRDMPLDK